MRAACPVYVEGVPKVICDGNGVEVSNTAGDTLYTVRMSRHRALNVAAMIVAAVSTFERQEANRDVVAPIP